MSEEKLKEKNLSEVNDENKVVEAVESEDMEKVNGGYRIIPVE